MSTIDKDQVVIFDRLMSSESLFLTGNTSTLYALPVLDLRVDGPTVVEVPPGMLGAFNDMWFRYIGDVGPAGPDRGAGGSYLVLPPGYDWIEAGSASDQSQAMANLASLAIPLATVPPCTPTAVAFSDTLPESARTNASACPVRFAAPPP